MGKKLDLTNKKFNRLTALEPTDKRSTAKEQANNRRDQYNQRSFIATNIKTGEVYESKSQRGFARKHGLLHGAISMRLYGRCYTHRDWTFEYITKGQQP